MKAIIIIAIVLLIILILKRPAFGDEAKMLGQPAPDFSLKNSGGELVNLSSFQGQWLRVSGWSYSSTQRMTPRVAQLRPALFVTISMISRSLMRRSSALALTPQSHIKNLRRSIICHSCCSPTTVARLQKNMAH